MIFDVCFQLSALLPPGDPSPLPASFDPTSPHFSPRAADVGLGLDLADRRSHRLWPPHQLAKEADRQQSRSYRVPQRDCGASRDGRRSQWAVQTLFLCVTLVQTDIGSDDEWLLDDIIHVKRAGTAFLPTTYVLMCVCVCCERC